MGASAWSYIEQLDQDVSAALVKLRGRVFEGSRFQGFVEDGTLHTFDRLAEEYEEEFAEAGTHSILDVNRVIPASESDAYRAVRMLSSEEITNYFGVAQPTRDQFDNAIQSDPLFAVGPRWTGRAVILRGEPGERLLVAFWGWSGD